MRAGGDIMKGNGFALTELIVVVAIIGTLLTIATIGFNSWTRKYGTEAQVKELLTDITAVRLRAIETKQQHRITLNPGALGVEFLTDAGVWTSLPGFSKTLKYPIQQFSSGAFSALNNTTLVFNERGYLPAAGLTIAVGDLQSGAAQNCLVIHTARINIGRINGNSCDLQ